MYTSKYCKIINFIQFSSVKKMKSENASFSPTRKETILYTVLTISIRAVSRYVYRQYESSDAFLSSIYIAMATLQ